MNEVPQGWQVLTIQELMDNGLIIDQMDGNHGELYPRSEEFTDSGVPYVTANDFADGSLTFNDCKYLPLKRASKFKKGIAKNGDVLFAHNATVGPSALLKTDLDYVILSTTATYFRCANDRLVNGYFLNAIRSRYFLSQIFSVMGQSTRNQVPITTQRKIAIALPTDVNEQKQIAEVLGDVDELILQLEKLIAKKRDIKQATMQQLLTGKTRLPGFSGQWEARPLGSLLREFKNGYAFSAAGYVSQGIPIITMAQIGLDGSFQYSEGKINCWPSDQSSKLSDFLIRKGELIIAMTDVTPEKNLIGRMVEINVDETFFLNQRVGWLKLRENEVDSFYLKIYSGSEKWRRYCVGAASLGVQANIGTKEIRSGLIDLPPIDEQKAISAIIKSMEEELVHLSQKLEKLKLLKQGMMQELLTGRIRLI